MLRSHQCITLIGHSGVGKTTLSAMLQPAGWYHYSADYRIATHYLREAMEDWLTEMACREPNLQRLISAGVARVRGHVEIDQLGLMSAYIGKIGQQGVPYAEFVKRQLAFAEAEKKAFYDVDRFIELAQRRFHLQAFINDAGGSLGEYIDDTALMNYLSERTLLVYIHADEDLQSELEARAIRYPKPICYDPGFLEKRIAEYGEISGQSNPDYFNSDDFLRFVGPKILRHRRDRYLQLAQKYGVVLDAKAVWQADSPAKFVQLLETACGQKKG